MILFSLLNKTMTDFAPSDDKSVVVVVDKWASLMSKYVKKEYRLCTEGDLSIFALKETGIQFCSVARPEAWVRQCDETWTCDWVFNCSANDVWKVTVGDFMVCSVSENLEKAVELAGNNVFLYTGTKDWIYLEKRDVYLVEIEGNKRRVWIGSPIRFDDVATSTCLEEVLTDDGFQFFKGTSDSCSVVNIILGRCEKSMWLLDSLHRDYIQERSWNKGEIVAVKSVAGSGKTTTLLTLAKGHREKRMLYIAFNKSLITEIGSKLKKQNIKNVEPKTFDALLYGLYRHQKESDPVPINLRPQNVGDYSSWLRDKPFGLRKGIVGNFSKWCNDSVFVDIKKFCIEVLGKPMPLLEGLWACVLSGQLTTFESIRKQAFIGHWCKDYIDKHYDMILIDETQDFDMMMLKMLLEDTTLPKLFVGDTKQAIYQWRGCINAFDYLPSSTIHVEFYSTFRVGEPACSIIRKQFDDCWMISKCERTTTIGLDSVSGSDDYVYLFRSWRVLLQTAQTMKDIWIYGFEKKMEEVRKLHSMLLAGGKFDEDDFEDDLPKFLKSITADDLEALIRGIEAGLVDKRVAKCKIYTVHAYKGLEHDTIRLAHDISKKNDENIYYVACTRGMKQIAFDEQPPAEEKNVSLAAAILRPVKKKTASVSASSGPKKAVIPFNPTSDLLDSTACKGDGDCLEQCGHVGHNGYCSMGAPCAHSCVPLACKNVAIYKCKTLYPRWILESHMGLCYDCRKRK